MLWLEQSEPSIPFGSQTGLENKGDAKAGIEGTLPLANSPFPHGAELLHDLLAGLYLCFVLCVFFFFFFTKHAKFE